MKHDYLIQGTTTLSLRDAVRVLMATICVNIVQRFHVDHISVYQYTNFSICIILFEILGKQTLSPSQNEFPSTTASPTKCQQPKYTTLYERVIQNGRFG